MHALNRNLCLRSNIPTKNGMKAPTNLPKEKNQKQI